MAETALDNSPIKRVITVGLDGTPTSAIDQKSTVATRSNVASSASSVTVLAANTARIGCTIYNDSTAILYLALGATTASVTNYTVQIAANAYYEVPFNTTMALSGIWAAANGFARVTELT